MQLTYIRQHPYIAALVGIVATLVTLFLIGVLLIIFYSESLLRFAVEDKGSDFLGREVSINGAARVEWHWRYLHLNVEDLSVKNPVDFKDAYMVKIEQIDL